MSNTQSSRVAALMRMVVEGLRDGEDVKLNISLFQASTGERLTFHEHG